jgi:hypothetical protein
VIEITHEQATRLFEASENLAALLMASACRVIYEAADDHDLLPYLDKLPAKAVRDFDQAVAAIQWPDDAPQKPPRCRASVAALEARLAELEAENARLREALVKEREANLWKAYGEGFENNGRWTHMRMADGEWLARECGFDPTLPDYDANEVKAAIPKAGRNVLASKKPITQADQ